MSIGGCNYDILGFTLVLQVISWIGESKLLNFNNLVNRFTVILCLAYVSSKLVELIKQTDLSNVLGLLLVLPSIGVAAQCYMQHRFSLSELVAWS